MHPPPCGGGECRPSVSSLSSCGLSLSSLAPNGRVKAAGEMSRVERPLEAFTRNFLSITSKFPLGLSIKARHEFSPVSGVEKERLPLMRRTTSQNVKVMEGFIAIFITCHNPHNSGLFSLVLHVHHGLLGAVLHIISRSEMQDDRFLPLCRACPVGDHGGGKGINEVSSRQLNASAQE